MVASAETADENRANPSITTGTRSKLPHLLLCLSSPIRNLRIVSLLYTHYVMALKA